MKKVKTRKAKKIEDALLIIFGTFILCMSTELFVLRFHILSGGVAGIAVAIYPLFHIDTTMFANVLTIAMLAAGGAFLGRDFFMSTAASSLLYPLFNMLVVRLFPSQPVVSDLLASFYGGLLGGIGVGMVMRAGASTGGMDVPPLVIHKLTGIKVSTLVLITDGMTVMLGFFTRGIEAVLIGLISVFASAYAINRVLSLGQGSVSKSVQIISDQWQTICEEITEQLNRSATIINAVGAFTGEERKMLVVAVDQSQYAALIEIIEQSDPKAFVITTDATDMHGEGFTYTGFRI